MALAAVHFFFEEWRQHGPFQSERETAGRGAGRIRHRAGDSGRVRVDGRPNWSISGKNKGSSHVPSCRIPTFTEKLIKRCLFFLRVSPTVNLSKQIL